MSETGTVRMGAVARWGFVVLMLALTALFVTLGFWQVARLEQKETLIAAVETRAGLPPAEFPVIADWPAIDPEAQDYRPLEVRGTYVADATLLVFTSLSDPFGRYGGAGYWIMTPLLVEDGAGLVWINRGFVPQDLGPEFVDGADVPEGAQTIRGLARQPEAANPFTPEPAFERRQDWVRDPVRLAAFLDDDLSALPMAPILLDRLAGEPGQLPQGGETVLTFSNRHLEYAGTWFAFALVTPLMLVIWYRRQRKG